MQITSVGIDLGKTTFHLVGLDAGGRDGARMVKSFPAIFVSAQDVQFFTQIFVRPGALHDSGNATV